MTNYPVPPPAYGPQNHSGGSTREPLLGSSSRGGGGGIYNQPQQGDLPDDFKVSCWFWLLRTTLTSSCSTEYQSLKVRLRSAMPSFAKFTPFFVRSRFHQYTMSLTNTPPHSLPNREANFKYDFSFLSSNSGHRALQLSLVASSRSLHQLYSGFKLSASMSVLPCQLQLIFVLFQHLGILRPPFWHSNQPWFSLLETPLSPMEFSSFVHLHPHGSFHPRHNRGFLQKRHCASSTVCFVSVLLIFLLYSFETSG